MSKKWPWTSKMYDSCLPKGQAGIQVFCVSCWGSKLTAGSQTCELQIICAVHVKHMWFILACETLRERKNLLLDIKPALIFSCENFCEFMGSYFLSACIAVMQCFLQTLERFCSTMLKIWHVDAWTLNFKFILSA